MLVSLLERFEAKFIPEPNTGCWLWIAGVSRGGYGSFKVGGKHVQAHRVAYNIFNGAIGGGLHVLHHCDIPQCVNPDHLFLGTAKTNGEDRMRKGRSSHHSVSGMAHGRAKVTNEGIISIRHDIRTTRAIAADFNISHQQVSRIKTGKRWK
jgi:hypothetical protein